jgi:hypothetical protein
MAQALTELHEDHTSEHDEDLPFAMSVHPTLQPNASHVADSCLGESSAAASSLLSSQNPPPGLTSSLLSNPTTDGESQASASGGAASLGYGHASFFPSSQYLDAAASMLRPAASVLNLSLVRSPQPAIAGSTTKFLLPPTEPNLSSLSQERTGDLLPTDIPATSFSVLLQAADDRYPEAAHRHDLKRQLTGLVEEEQELSLASASVLSTSASSRPIYCSAEMVRGSIVKFRELSSALESPPEESSVWRSTADGANAASDERRADAWYTSHQLHSGSQTIVPAAYSVSSSPATPGGRSRLFRTEERRMAALAGATATRTGETSFMVSLDLSPSYTSIRDVMDVVGNPDMLLLWCDALTGLIVTRSSEGTRNYSLAGRHPRATSASSESSPSPSVSGSTGTTPEREYDGEWIEATTPPLVAPRNTSCLHSTGRALSSALGFPTFGKLVMFVERSRGQVSLTMAPFPGGIEVLYKIRVDAMVGGRVRIVNDVRLRRAASEDSYDSLSFCGLWDLVEKCLFPTIDDYIDQVLSSSARLRFLVENKRATMNVDDSTSPSRHQTQHGVSTTPLLAGV